MTDHADKGRGLGVAAALVVVAALALAAGVRWHGRIAPMLGWAADPAKPAADGRKQLWTCSMHPQVIREEPGLCPICHMQLTPLKTEPAGGAHADHEVVIDPAVVQNMGVRTETVGLGVLDSGVEAVGTLMEREPDLVDINLRVSGWIEHLYANTDGMEVRKGEPLFDLYSPDLSQAIEELIAARRESERASQAGEEVRQIAGSLREAARAKLLRLGLAAAEIEALGALDVAPRIVTFVSPRSGHVRDKMNLDNGSEVKVGQRVLRIVDPSVLWVEARVYERDLGRIRIGQRAEARIDAYPGETFTGLVSFIHPHLDETTRAGVVRINVANEISKLREGMFASVRIRTDPGPEALLAPREAVIDTGERRIVFVALGDGRFEPRLVSVGVESGDGRVQILRGLSPGDHVVVSGQFLLDSESRLREAVRKFAPGPAPTSTAPSPVPAAPAPLAFLSRLDAVFSSYLAMSQALGKVQESTDPLDPAGLVAAARALQGAAAAEQDRSLAAAVQAAAQALAGQKLDEQRERFKPLGVAMLHLAEARPPTTRVAPQLYHMHCPMAPGDWLQVSDAIANPFYPEDMKECGEIVKMIPARAEGAQPR